MIKKEFTVHNYIGIVKFFKNSMIVTTNNQIKALKIQGVKTKSFFSKYDVIDINVFGVLEVMVIFFNKLFRRKVIIHSHSTDEDFEDGFNRLNFFRPFFKIWLNFFYSLCDVLIAPSEYTKNYLKKNYSLLKSKKIYVVSNGVDTDFFKYSEVRKQKFKKEHNLKGEVISSTGFVSRRKGFKEFINLAKKFPKKQFIWVGITATKFQKGEEFNFKKIPKNLKLTGYVNDIIGAYSSIDIYISTSHSENEGMTLLEAASVGIPIIARDLSVYKTFLKNDYNCLLSKNDEEFEQKLELLLKDKNLRKKLVKNAKKMTEERDLENIGKKLKKIYEEVLEK